jgi:hypothetical protein
MPVGGGIGRQTENGMGTDWRLRLSAVACVTGAVLALTTSAQAFQLITKREAALPVARGGYERGISRGPTITVVSPSPAAGTIQSPLELEIKFKSHGGARIDVDSVLVTYMKDPTVDLTQRIKPFIAATGIDAPDAQVPPGRHWLRVSVTDTNGRPGWIDFTFRVSQ